MGGGLDGRDRFAHGLGLLPHQFFREVRLIVLEVVCDPGQVRNGDLGVRSVAEEDFHDHDDLD